jgi:hypothetical protein
LDSAAFSKFREIYPAQNAKSYVLGIFGNWFLRVKRKKCTGEEKNGRRNFTFIISSYLVLRRTADSSLNQNKSINLS